MREQLKDISAKFCGLAMLVLAGFFVIIYAALGVVYFQQHQRQNDLTTQINRAEQSLALPVDEVSEADYQKALQSIPTQLKTKDVISKILKVAEENGFDVSDISKDITIISDKIVTEKVGENNYRVLP